MFKYPPSQPLPTDPKALAAGLVDRVPLDTDVYPRVLTDDLFHLAMSRHLTTPERATTLRTLATLPTLTYRGETTDIAGRTGLTFAVTTTRLTIDPDTGELLLLHEYDTRKPAELGKYLLILERARTAGPDITETQPL
ncbi:hypothetical protein [Micromonospora sp. SH-82]|uniref:hypothetical protein n=1 Tax=Micromonospora sp. SH-82 TaxID=3132938 RepID=UPI003EC0B125